MKAGRAVRFSLATVIFVAAAMSMFFLLNRGEASAACDDRAGSELSLLCVKPTTTTTTFVETTTTTTTLPEETTTTTLPEETTTTTLAVAVTSTIPTEVLPTVITTSTTSSTTSTTAEVGGIVVLPFTGSSEGALLGLAIGLVALGTIAVTAVRGSRSED